MLKSELDRRSELLIMSEEVNEEDLTDGARDAILSLIKAEGFAVPSTISSKAELMDAVEWFLGRHVSDIQMSHVLTAFRLLWAGYYREVVLEAKHRYGEEGYRSQAVRRFRDAVLTKFSIGWRPRPLSSPAHDGLNSEPVTTERSRNLA